MRPGRTPARDPLLDRGRVASQEIGRHCAGAAEEMASGSFSRSFPAHCALGSASYPARSARARFPRTSTQGVFSWAVFRCEKFTKNKAEKYYSIIWTVWLIYKQADLIVLCEKK